MCPVPDLDRVRPWYIKLGGPLLRPKTGGMAYGDSLVKGGRGGDLPEILHTICFLLKLPEFFPLFCPNLGGQLPKIHLPKNWVINVCLLVSC